MSDMNETTTKIAPLEISRHFDAPRALVFEAWGTADHVKRWFCPAHFTAPEAVVDFIVGGRFEVCMRAPSGQDFWTRGTFAEIVPNERLVIDMNAIGEDGSPLFRAYTIVTFSDKGGGTLLEVTQSYTLYQAFAAAMIGGAEPGWSQTLDKLGDEVRRMRAA